MIANDNTAVRWCMLRTAGCRTVKLAASLRAAGYDAWTPAVLTHRNVIGNRPSKNASLMPVISTFVFAREADLAELAYAAKDPASHHPDFSFFMHAGRIPLVAGRSLAPLRKAETDAAIERALRLEEQAREAELAQQKKDRAALMRREQARRKALRSVHRTFAVGTPVRVAEAPAFSGLRGCIVSSRGSVSMVSFGGLLPIEIEAWRLSPFDVEQSGTIAA